MHKYNPVTAWSLSLRENVWFFSTKAMVWLQGFAGSNMLQMSAFSYVKPVVPNRMYLY